MGISGCNITLHCIATIFVSFYLTCICMAEWHQSKTRHCVHLLLILVLPTPTTIIWLPVLSKEQTKIIFFPGFSVLRCQILIQTNFKFANLSLKNWSSRTNDFLSNWNLIRRNPKIKNIYFKDCLHLRNQTNGLLYT